MSTEKRVSTADVEERGWKFEAEVKTSKHTGGRVMVEKTDPPPVQSPPPDREKWPANPASLIRWMRRLGGAEEDE